MASAEIKSKMDAKEDTSEVVSVDMTCEDGDAPPRTPQKSMRTRTFKGRQNRRGRGRGMGAVRHIPPSKEEHQDTDSKEPKSQSSNNEIQKVTDNEEADETQVESQDEVGVKRPVGRPRNVEMKRKPKPVMFPKGPTDSQLRSMENGWPLKGRGSRGGRYMSCREKKRIGRPPGSYTGSVSYVRKRNKGFLANVRNFYSDGSIKPVFTRHWIVRRPFANVERGEKRVEFVIHETYLSKLNPYKSYLLACSKLVNQEQETTQQNQEVVAHEENESDTDSSAASSTYSYQPENDDPMAEQFGPAKGRKRTFDDASEMALENGEESAKRAFQHNEHV